MHKQDQLYVVFKHIKFRDELVWLQYEMFTEDLYPCTPTELHCHHTLQFTLYLIGSTLKTTVKAELTTHFHPALTFKRRPGCLFGHVIGRAHRCTTHKITNPSDRYFHFVTSAHVIIPTKFSPEGQGKIGPCLEWRGWREVNSGRCGDLQGQWPSKTGNWEASTDSVDQGCSHWQLEWADATPLFQLNKMNTAVIHQPHSTCPPAYPIGCL